MTIIIFFGGLLLGFLIGWVFMAILSLVSMNRQEKGSYEEALISILSAGRTGSQSLLR